MIRYKSHFGSQTRAVDGCIVTYELPDGSTIVKRFTTIMHHKRSHPYGPRSSKKIGATYLEQAIAYADEHGAKIVSISTPETILRDLRGTRAAMRPDDSEFFDQEVINVPERAMLKGRADLIKQQPLGQRTQSEHMPQHVVRSRSRAGKLDQ